MSILNKYSSFIVVFLLLLTGCRQQNKPVETTPWGTPIHGVPPDDYDTLKQTHYTLDDILENGEMIVLTISGPDTYYDYHGHGMGVQYMMCESFAREIGVTLRVELCKDTLEMIDKLEKGYGDVIAVPLSKEKYKPKQNGSDGVGSNLYFCGAKDDKGCQWAVHVDNQSLAAQLNLWYKPEMLANTIAQEDYLLSKPVIHSASFISQHKTSNYYPKNSNYTELFQRYAPLAGLDWHLIAAQCYQESSFDPQARSWAGACGLMQLMPSTAARFGLSKSEIFDPEKNVQTACRLMGVLMHEFSDVPNRDERISFALASYNAGSGHVRDAMALARSRGDNPHTWASVSPYILKLSDKAYYQDPVVRYGFMRGKETYNYVNAIRARWHS